MQGSRVVHFTMLAPPRNHPQFSSSQSLQIPNKTLMYPSKSNISTSIFQVSMRKAQSLSTQFLSNFQVSMRKAHISSFQNPGNFYMKNSTSQALGFQ